MVVVVVVVVLVGGLVIESFLEMMKDEVAVKAYVLLCVCGYGVVDRKKAFAILQVITQIVRLDRRSISSKSTHRCAEATQREDANTNHLPNDIALDLSAKLSAFFVLSGK